MRLLVTIPVAVAVAVAVAGCTAPPGGGAGGGRGVGEPLVLADANEPDSLSPLSAMYGLTDKLYSGLYDVTGMGTVEPDLADGPPAVAADHTSVSVTIDDGHQFSDGTPVTAADVAATYTAAVDPHNAAPIGSHLTMIDTVHADGTTVVFELDQPYAGFETLLTVGIAPAELVSAGPGDESSLGREPVGSGPYQLDQWRPGESLVLRANPHHTPAPPVDEVVVMFIADQNAVMQRLHAGEIHGAQLAPALATTFADQDGWEVWEGPSADYRAVTFPPGHPGFADPQVRRAVNMAVDRRTMVDTLAYGYGEPAHTPFTAAQGDMYAADAQFDHDPDAARDLLDDAGWTTGPDQTARTNAEGTPLSMTLMYFPDDLLRRDLAVAFADDMAQIGVEVAVEAVPSETFTTRIADDAALFGGGDMPYHPDQHVAAVLDSARAGYDPADPYANPSGYTNAAVDDLLRRGRGAVGPARTSIYRQLQHVYVDDPAMVTLISLTHTYVAADTSGWTIPDPVLEPHEHGVSWGPWRQLDSWQRR